MANFTSQKWLSANLPNKDIKELLLSPLEKEKVWEKDVIRVGGTLTGDLVIENYPNLEEVKLSEQRLTSLKISNCPHLKRINVRGNQLSKLEITGSNQIAELIAGQNRLETLNLTNCPKISCLMIPDNPLLTKIKGLDLSTIKAINVVNTSVNLGLKSKLTKWEFSNYLKFKLDFLLLWAFRIRYTREKK